VVVHQDSTSKVITIQTLKPQKLHSKLQSSAPLEKLPVLAEKTRSKPVSGYYFNQTGWLAYLKGEKLDAEKHLVKTETLWKLDNRIGIGLNADTRSVEDGKLFTTQAVAFKENIGFYTALNCPEKLERGLLRLGGDGRAAGFGPISPLDETVNVHDLVSAKAFKLVLTTPALLANGWQPSLPFATLVAAAVSRAEVISGWDLANWQPKAAQRVAPTGSVYWFEGFTGTANDLQNLLDNGLPCPDLTRQIEGFNRCSLAHWSSKNAGL
jgi:CRISPR-associated protein Cmr3